MIYMKLQISWNAFIVRKIEKNCWIGREKLNYLRFARILVDFDPIPKSLNSKTAAIDSRIKKQGCSSSAQNVTRERLEYPN